VVGIIGGNGAGKSTLFRMIMAKDAPDGGRLELGETVVPMWVDQSREGLDADKTVRGGGKAAAAAAAGGQLNFRGCSLGLAAGLCWLVGCGVLSGTEHTSWR
jgi:ATPase subunit of ABC transporter with duplicated ATPase domains